MLFSVDPSIANELTRTPIPAIVVAAFSRLLDSYADGFHILLLEPRYCRILESTMELSETQRASASKIRNRFADYGDLPTKVRLHCNVVLEGNSPQYTDGRWKVPVRWLAARPLMPSSLLAEDLHDTDVLSAAGEDFLEASSLRAFQIRTSKRQGGGTNTHRVLRHIAIEEQEICVCVADSDKVCPASPVGDVAQQCLDVEGNGLFMVTTTEGRALENALPTRLVDQVHPARTPRPSEQFAGFDARHAGVQKFISLKKGMSGFDAERLPRPESREFWNSACAAIVGLRTCCAGVCQAAELPRCSYQLHRGFGSGLLAAAAEWLKSHSRFDRTKEYLPSPNDSDWKRLGEMVASYAIGLERRRI